jgi:competence protein ComGC
MKKLLTIISSLLDFKVRFKSIFSAKDVRQPKRQSTLGLTLVELIVALLISSILLIVAGSALINILTVNEKASAKIERRIDLSRAFDFISYEVRTSKRVNSSETKIVNGGDISVEDVVTSTGLNLASLGSYGTMVLYLEIPTIDDPPAICPAGTDRAGSPPPAPTDYDRVVYDIRPNPTNWLSPRIISRYGRIPSSDGTIDPCQDPISSDVLVDSISDRNISPSPSCTTPAVLSGSGGFYACVNGGLVDLYMQSKLGDLKTHNLASKAFSRLSSTNTLAAPILSGTRSSDPTKIDLSWTWSGSNDVTFKVYRVLEGVTTEVYSGSNTRYTDLLAGNSGDANCYTVTASVSSYTSDYSNQVCENK